MRILFLFLLLQLAQQHHRAAVAPMTLEDIETAATANNPEVRVMEQRVVLAKAAVIPAAGFDDPQFMYWAWGTPLLQPWNVNQTQHMFMFSQTIPGSGKRELRYEAASQGVDVAEAELDSRKLDIASRVRAAFYDLLRNNDELRLHDQQIALAEQAVAAARIKYTVGRVPQQDVLKAQIGLTKLAEHLTMFIQDGDLTRARLNTLMGRDPAAPLEVEGDYENPSGLPSIAELQQTALDHRPELKAIETAVRQGETKVRLSEKNYKPDVTLTGGYMLMPAGSVNRNGYIAEISLNLPWLNRSRHDAEIQEAQSQANAVRSELQTQRAMIFEEIQEAFIRANSAARLVELYRDTLRPQAQATLRSASAAYQTDETDFLNLIDSQNTALDVEYSYYRSLSDFDSRVADLEHAIGMNLPRKSVARLEVKP
jgi:cobalt-zinc-cadmium efflux system outer membrane protein